MFLPNDLSAKLFITLPNTDKDWFIEHPSLNLSPYALVLENFSDPAKSTRFIYDIFSTHFPKITSN